MLETKRLILRGFVQSDLDSLVKHRSDPEVMKYLGGVPKRTAVNKRLKAYRDFYAIHGYAMCAIIWRGTDEFIGVGGLQDFGESRGVEVGYTVEKRFWGRGIATEITLACLEYGFGKIILDQIIGLTHPENAASKRVLEKCGMHPAPDSVDPERGFLKYVISSKEFNAVGSTNLPKT